MRGWIFKALIFVTLCAAPLWAQRGGGGGPGGFGGGHGFSGGGHAGAPAGYHSSAGYGPGYRGSTINGWRGNGWRGYPYRYWGGRGYPYWGYGYWYPWWGGYGYYGSFDDYSSYDQSYGPGGEGYPPYDSQYAYLPPSGSAASYASEGEVQRIQNEVAQLRAQQTQRYSEPVHPATVLVYRDGHRETVENYAIAGDTLWVLNQNRARKVPLSNLDLPATKRDNDQRGVDFAVPDQP